MDTIIQIVIVAGLVSLFFYLGWLFNSKIGAKSLVSADERAKQLITDAEKEAKNLKASLRTSKELGQSNFVNPGLGLVGVGADFDILPELRLIANASWLTFDSTSSLRVLRNQGPIDKEIGYDVSAGLVYRPLFIENIVFRLSGAVLFPEDGMKQLFNDDNQSFPFYSVLANLILTY